MVRVFVASLALLLLSCGLADVQSEEEDFGQLDSGLGAVPRAWFAPNVGARDTLKLFESPATWARARGRLDVFQLYAQNISSTAPGQCPACNDVILPNLERVGAFSKLKSWNVSLAFEVGSVKHHTCQGERAADHAADLAGLVKARGGEVAFVAMDEPYIGGNQQVGTENCNYSRDQSADQVARFVQRLAQRAPAVKVGDIEPYPYFTVGQLQAWVDALRARNVKLAFFHVDIDRNHVKKSRADVYGDMAKLRTFLAARGIPMGIIFNGHEIEVPQRTDAQYYDVVYAHAKETKAKLGLVDQVIVQSWFQVNGQNTLPSNLPFESKGHTRLFFEIAGLFGFMGSSPDDAVIKVEHAYLGLLGRPSDPGGLAGWADALRSGKTSAWMCDQFAASPEFRANRAGLSPEALAEELYRGILGREGEPAGLAATATEIRNGRLGVRAGAMLDSPEFRERFLR